MTNQSTHLDRIIDASILKVEARKRSADLPALEAKAANHRPRGFAQHLRCVAAERPAIIAELKKASPSKGLLAETYHPASTAKVYQAGAAAAISVLTDEDFFGGSLADLHAVSAVVQIPVLRKDFIFDPFQILEARAAGADAVLLIVAAHSDAALRTLGEEAQRHQLDVLCEVHDRAELSRALDLGFATVGVNSRNLKTLEVHPSTLTDLVGLIPSHILRVAESGIATPADVAHLRTRGYQAFLIGEALMRQSDPAGLLAAFQLTPQPAVAS